MNVVIVVTSE